MTTQVPEAGATSRATSRATGSATSSGRRARGLAAAALLTVVAVVAGYLLGQRSAESADWHTTTIDRADVVSSGTHRLLTVSVDGWSYGLENEVPRWIDGSGLRHDGGWPDCLEPAHPGGVPARNPGTVTFRFASVDVRADGVGWRPVVMVDCRSTSS